MFLTLLAKFNKLFSDLQSKLTTVQISRESAGLQLEISPNKRTTSVKTVPLPTVREVINAELSINISSV